MTQEIQTERVSLKVEGEQAPMAAYVARPAGPGRYPGVLLFMEIFGINSHIRDVTERIAREGYVVLAPDIYHRTAPGIELGYDQDGFAKGMPLLQQLERPQVLRDIRAAIDHLRSRPDVIGDRLGAIGFCIGGHLAFLAATQFDLRATASFYGGAIASSGIKLGRPEPTLSLAPGIARHGGRILCLFGAKDPMIPAAEVQAIEQALKNAGVRHEVVVYPEAGHAFFRDHPNSLHAPSRDDAWERVKRLFAEEFRHS